MKHLLTILAAGTALAGLAGLTALSVLVLLVIPVALGILTIEFGRFKNRLRRMGGWRRRTGLVLKPEIQP